jgi:hypothetical protein
MVSHEKEFDAFVEKVLQNLPFLTISDVKGGKSLYVNLFNKNISFLKSKNNEDLVFRVSSSWNGKILKGRWYYKNLFINNEHDLFKIMHKDDIKYILFYPDFFEKITTWELQKATYIEEI